MYPKQIQCIFYALLVGRSHPKTEKAWSVGMIIPAKLAGKMASIRRFGCLNHVQSSFLAGKLIKSLRFFSSNPICLNIFGCNFPIFTGLFTFFGVMCVSFTSFGRFLRSLQPHISPGRRRRWRRRGHEPRPAVAVTIFNRWPMVMIRKSWVIYGGFQKWLVYVYV